MQFLDRARFLIKASSHLGYLLRISLHSESPSEQILMYFNGSCLLLGNLCMERNAHWPKRCMKVFPRNWGKNAHSITL